MRTCFSMNYRFLVWSTIIVSTLNTSCWGIFANVGDNIPVERLIENLERYVKNHPNDAHGYYVLGRVHSMAFAKNAKVVRLVEPDWGKSFDQEANPIKFSPYDRVQVTTSYAGKVLTPETRRHLLESINNYNRAVELDSKPPQNKDRFHDQRLYFLGLAWMLEMGEKWAGQLGGPSTIGEQPKPTDESRKQVRQLLSQLSTAMTEEREAVMRRMLSLPTGLSVVVEAVQNKDEYVNTRAVATEALKFHWRETALNVYRKAYLRRLEVELTRTSMYSHNQTESIISLEAAKGIERILSARHRLTREEESELAKLRETVQHFNSLSQWITPVIVGNSEHQSLVELLDDERTVEFDLDGTGRRHSWPWVKPDTGILVWDPDHSGQITSGRQLFGSVTWWIFWDHGYEALAALDDDNDGELTGAELTGIGVWRDRNANGVSEEGEVRKAIGLNIVSIDVNAIIGTDGVMFNRQGIHLRSGRKLPTFDWIPKSKPSPTDSSRSLFRDSDIAPSSLNRLALAQFCAFRCHDPDPSTVHV